MNRTDEKRLAEVKAQIERLTHRAVVSNDLKYLERRLEDLKTRKKSGEDVVRRPPASPSVVLSVSMTEDARSALLDLVDKTHMGASALVRRALGEYARRHGFEKQADGLLGEED